MTLEQRIAKVAAEAARIRAEGFEADGTEMWRRACRIVGMLTACYEATELLRQADVINERMPYQEPWDRKYMAQEKAELRAQAEKIIAEVE
jgi:hypothetical protein